MQPHDTRKYLFDIAESCGLIARFSQKFPPRHFPGQPFPQDSSSLMIQKATISRFLEAEMPLKRGK